MKRTTRLARQLYQKLAYKPVTVSVLQRIHKLAGEFCFARAENYTQGFVANVLGWRDGWFWHTQQAFGTFYDSRNESWWRHASVASRGRKWDEPFIDCFGPE